MAVTNKLYPSLEEFYKNNNIEYGDEDIWYSVTDQKLYRTRKRANKCKDLRDNVIPFKNITGEEEATQIIPTAPPLEEISWDELGNLEYYPDYSLIGEESFHPPDAPNEDLRLNNNSWVDDIRPDYDDDNATDADSADINNSTIVIRIQQTNPDKFHSSKPTQKHRNNPLNTNARPGRTTDNVNKRQNAQSRNPTVNKLSQNSDEYSAWVTWRKQVNRQLASLILLRRGDHVHLQTVDLSRKPLSKTSVKEVLQKATNDCSKESMTSLNGKPYIMYGIPRVALAKSSTTS